MTTIPRQSPLVVGLGCSTAASADEIIALVAACLAEIHCSAQDVAALATHMRKRGSRALAEAAEHFDLPLRVLADGELAPGIAGTCEAVAAAAGPLLLGKRKSRFATCAIAACRPGFTVAGFGQSANSSAAMASSTLATSLAGP